MSWGAVVLTFLLIGFVVVAYLRPTLPLEGEESGESAKTEPPAR